MKFNKKRAILMFLFSFLFIGTVSANGLSVEINDTLVVNKTFNQDYYVNLTIKNTDSIDFYNISFEENPYLSIIEIPKLSSGEKKTVSAKIITNEEIDLKLKLKGFYEATIGSSKETYNVDITYPDGSSLCSFTSIMGDTIIFENKETYEIKMRDINSGEEIKVFGGSESFNWNMDTPKTITYKLLRNGYLFGDICTITVLDEDGFVNNPELDGSLDIKTNIIYPNTILTTEFTETSYIMDFSDSEDGFVKIINNGQNLAKRVHLDGDWFSFSDNDFDVLPGEYRTILYTLSTKYKQFNTDDTNKSYIQNLTISGNFEEINQNFQVFVNHAIISNSSNYSGENIQMTEQEASLMVSLLCERFPNCQSCQDRYITSSSGLDDLEFNVTTTQEKQDGLAQATFEVRDYAENIYKTVSEMIESVNKTSQESVNRANELTEKIEKISEDDSETNSIVKIVVYSLIFMALCIGGFFAIKKTHLRKINRELMHK